MSMVEGSGSWHEAWRKKANAKIRPSEQWNIEQNGKGFAAVSHFYDYPFFAQPECNRKLATTSSPPGREEKDGPAGNGRDRDFRKTSNSINSQPERGSGVGGGRGRSQGKQGWKVVNYKICI
ncbi:hypothetical protein ZHAS_00017544 [Anopheles sinensis]|uniref:Uncharacterized protein n=1 Tax=Anopheles sinensis TaxID=74873 RepID=A0A084WGL5_ANOSI|nr:hypothetical protein ZHAS_00017544 [Anopheles sinensis]